MLVEQDTIAALSTAPGKAAVSIIRISGSLAWEFAFRSSSLGAEQITPRKFYYVTLNGEGEEIDDVLLLFFASPDSYTGEDILEIQSHGSPFITSRIIESCLRFGIRSARPGEFTYRAVLNGKMDLTQAEAVRDLIESRTALQGRIARQTLKGRLSSHLTDLKQSLVSIASQMETSLEFVEDDVSPESRNRILERIDEVIEKLSRLGSSYRQGRIVRDGVMTVLAGTTNTGKSLIFNILSEEDRAIVTSHAGTTRDVIVEELDLSGIPFILHDTAGIRAGTGEIEGIGVAKSLEHFNRASLILFVLDGSRPWSRDDQDCWDQIKAQRVILAINKIDLPRKIEIPGTVRENCLEEVEISALQGINIEGLIDAMVRQSLGSDSDPGSSLILSNLRQKHCLDQALAKLRECRESYRAGASEEYPLYDLRECLKALGQMTGEVTAEDILDEVFSTFCIGK